MKPRLFLSAFALTLLLGSASEAAEQTPPLQFPAPSPACTIKQRVGLTDIEVAYSRPSMKGRQIFGSLVPYGAVWRTGANNATKISFSTPAKLDGTSIEAGSYALYTIPEENEWTIILNKGVGQSGTQYDEKADVARFKVTPLKLSDMTVETFTIEFNQVRDESTILMLLWENTMVPIKVELDLTSKLLPQIEQAMSGTGARKPYYQAAMFYYDHDQDLKKARQWVDAALANVKHIISST